MVLTSAFSAGNSYVYCASRSLYGLALEGKAPAIFARCGANGVPVYAVALVLAIALLSFLQVSNQAAVVLQWFVNLVTASQLINFSVMCLTYLRFHAALRAQGISRDSLPYRARLQPYAAWYGLAGCFVMTFVGGYTTFLPGHWDVPSFFFSSVLRAVDAGKTALTARRYTMIAVCPILYFGWKFFHKTKIYRAGEVDLMRSLDEIEDYERSYVPKPPK